MQAVGASWEDGVEKNIPSNMQIVLHVNKAMVELSCLADKPLPLRQPQETKLSVCLTVC